MTNTPAANFSIRGILVLVASFSFEFLTGSTAVFIGIGAEVAGAAFRPIGAQRPKHEHGLGDTGYIDPDEPRRNT
ncbi:hypothetical protein [Corynebacterium liangguodongii]|uniref:Uncharacterized protein n=1 Tax=Corynebacterium liangguodongii TaxID=2079535 RepID=A0A2S0WGF3_9CORY|nr:hypothetical protein [Corynebacterium liangguodongii]AWB84849.1 hypothetical protein C3E79_10515 [Corynebacterium liangguodongii]PWB99206.1 hypothetical protein DF219_08130 [Corynebacterium liangguodongii]